MGILYQGEQSSAPSAPSAGYVALYFKSDGLMYWKDDAGNEYPVVYTGGTGLFGNGTVSAPSISFSSDTNTGLYRIGADNLGVAVGGAKILDVAATGLSVTGALSSTGNITVGSNILGSGNTTAAYSIGTNADFAGGGIIQLYGSAAGDNVDVLTTGAVRGRFSSTGLSVTGTISATGRINANASDYQIGIYDGVGEPWYLRQTGDTLAIHRNATGDIATFAATSSSWVTSTNFYGDVGNLAQDANSFYLAANSSETGLVGSYRKTGNYAIGVTCDTSAGAVRFTTAAIGTAGNAITFVEQVRITHTASAVNYLSLTGAATGGSVSLYATGSDTNVNMALQLKGAGVFTFQTGAGSAEQVRIAHVASAVNYLQLTGSSTGTRPEITFTGSDTNVGGGYVTKGSGSHAFYTNLGAATLQVAINHTASANRYITLTGSNGGNPTIGTSAGDLAISSALVLSQTTLLKTSVALTNGAAANTGTLTNAPAVGNPTKWIPIDDNGTTRYIPAW